VVCYLPYFTVTIFVLTGLLAKFIDLAWGVAISFVMFNLSLNPFLYCWMMRDVRQAMKNTIKQLWFF